MWYVTAAITFYRNGPKCKIAKACTQICAHTHTDVHTYSHTLSQSPPRKPKSHLGPFKPRERSGMPSTGVGQEYSEADPEECMGSLQRGSVWVCS